ncbi:MAG: protein serine/threonine phosphatase 2C family protein [Tessaracoccus sp.]|uniref:PP2C family protein-serine/threonine phosphatase n=1 Tax=Tessaracoccus sp. TaxID=1971211 RepID=UPI001ED27A8D|nr:protein phosphatase 2C domain-containing protein [Tessaracoccus sp.]MBK7820349.1 protein serine/threonine phosphatase 2C family protein [Tessaracoccus sp.]
MTDPASPARAHYVLSPAPWIGGCSDIGLRHATNQDAMSLAAREVAGRTAIAVISDGVTTAPGAEEASRLAAEAAAHRLVDLLDRGESPSAALPDAFDTANSAVIADREYPSACTLVAAVVQGATITVGSVGDSRAYWFGDDGAKGQLSTDDSMAQARILLGMTREEAEQSIQAHAITRWLGRDSTDWAPGVVEFTPDGDGWLLLCSDGLWNYASSPDELAAVFAERAAGAPTPASGAEALAAWANAQGGRDNVTVVLARITR